MNFFEIVKLSFEITWKNKKLWILGFFASIFAGANLNFSNPFSGSNFYQFKNLNPQPQNLGHAAQGLVAGVKDINSSQFVDIFAKNYIWILIICFLLLTLVVFIFSVICRAGLINQIFTAVDKKSVFVKTGITSGWHHFWQFLAIMILISLGASIPLLILIGLSILIIIFKVYWLLIIIFLAFLIWIVWIIYLTLLSNLALRFCVDQKKGSFASIRLANELFREQFKNILLFWLIELGLKIGIGIIFAFAILILIFLGFLICYLIYLTGILSLFYVILSLTILIFIIILFLLNGIILTYFDSYWNLIYLGFKKKYQQK